MSRAREAVDSRSLRKQVAGLERRLVLRRQRVRNVVAGISRTFTSRMVAPGTLLVAVGFGAALEQSGHRSGWSLPNLLDATNAGLRLLLTFSSSMHHSPVEPTPSVWQRTDLPAGQV
jgi:hypothetical protein